MQEEEEGRDGGNEEVLVDVTDSPVIPAFCSSDEDEETPLDWLPYAPEVEEPEEPGWGQLEPALNELPSNKRAHKDEGEESASKRPCPLTVDIELPEPANEVIQVKPGGGGGVGKNYSSKSKKEIHTVCPFYSLSLSLIITVIRYCKSLTHTLTHLYITYIQCN